MALICLLFLWHTTHTSKLGSQYAIKKPRELLLRVFERLSGPDGTVKTSISTILLGFSAI